MRAESVRSVIGWAGMAALLASAIAGGVGCAPTMVLTQEERRMTVEAHERAAAEEVEHAGGAGVPGEDHRKRGDAHRAAALALREAEGKACAGITPENAGRSVFLEMTVVSAEPMRESWGGRRVGGYGATRTSGVGLTAITDLRAEEIERRIACHVAHVRAWGGDDSDPTLVEGATVHVHGKADRVVHIEVMASVQTSAEESLRRAERLVRR